MRACATSMQPPRSPRAQCPRWRTHSMQYSRPPLGPSFSSDITSVTLIRSRMSAGRRGWASSGGRRQQHRRRHACNLSPRARTESDLVLEDLRRGVEVGDAHRAPRRRAVVLQRLAVRRLARSGAAHDQLRVLHGGSGRRLARANGRGAEETANTSTIYSISESRPAWRSGQRSRFGTPFSTSSCPWREWWSF